MICKSDTLAAAGPLQRRIQRAQTVQRRNVRFGLTLSEADAELWDRINRRLGQPGEPLPHNRSFSRMLHNLALVIGEESR